MSNIISITSYSNDELLYIILDQLSSSKEIFNYGIRVYTEPGYCTGIDEVISRFSHLDIKLKVRDRIKCPLVGFHNILESYRDSAAETDEYIIVLEDDIIPRQDTLSYCDYIYRNFLDKYERIYCFGHKIRGENELIGDPQVLIGDYQMASPLCISKKSIEKYLLPHLTSDLYENPVEYYFKNFRNSRIPWNAHLHHDVFHERIMWKNKLFGLKPDMAISGHMGLKGINSKGTPPQGTLEERIKEYKELMKDGNRLRSLSTTPADLVVAPDWIGGNWGKLILDKDRNKSLASNWHYDTINEFKDYINE